MKRVLIGSLLCLSSTSIFANDRYFSGEILLGSTDQEVNGDSGSDTSFGLRGTYNINPNVGVEFSYQNYGEADWTYIDGFGDTINEKTASDSLNLGIKGVLPLQNGFSLNARLGIAFWNVDVDITDSSLPGQTFSGDDSGNDIYYGIGGQYTINEKFIIGIEYTLSEFGVSLGGDLDGISADLELNTLAVTVGQKF